MIYSLLSTHSGHRLRFRLSARRNAQRGMTLVELLVVIVIIGMLFGAAASVFNGPRNEVSVKGGVDICASLVAQATTLAKNHHSSVRLAINVDEQSRGYARQLALFVRNSTGQWVLKAGPHLLPRQIYIDREQSAGYTSDTFDFARATPQLSTGDDAITFEFDRNGHFVTPPASTDDPRLILVAGFVPETSPRSLQITEPQKLSRSGFLFRRNGYVTRYESPAQIFTEATP